MRSSAAWCVSSAPTHARPSRRRAHPALHAHLGARSPSRREAELPGWAERSPFIEQIERLNFHHYDFYAQALAKIERGHAQDVQDVQAMSDGLVRRDELMRSYEAIEPRLYLFPAIAPAVFRGAVSRVCRA